MKAVEVMVCLAFAATVHAQVTTNRVEITLSNRCDEVVKPAIVLDDEDRAPREIHQLRPCTWYVEFPRTFSTSLSHFSLRLGIARTACHQADGDENDSTKPARLDYVCCLRDPVLTISIETDPASVPISYLRAVSPAVPTLRKDPRSVPCLEQGRLGDGEREIDHVQFRSETLHLQVGSDRPNRGLVGLLAHRLPDGAMSADDVLYRLIDQRAKGLSKSTPSLSSNALEIDAIRLAKSNLKQLVVKVGDAK